MNINRQWLLAKRPNGFVTRENFEYVECQIPEPASGQILVKNLLLSFDPTQRGWMEDKESYLPPVAIGAPMRAGSIGQVTESRHPDFAVGELVQTTGGWQDFVVATPNEGPIGLTKVPDSVTPEMMLSVLGITGLTAYFGMLDLGTPKPGETVLVSGAAGATGSVAGQIARIKGCRVVGIAGGAAKCAWLKDEAGFDAVIDYKQGNINDQIRATCPEKIDVYFDNVGGEILEAALNHINLRARVVMCGGISGYNATEPTPGPTNLMNLVTNRARMEGFIILDYLPRAAEAIADLREWIGTNDLKYQIDLQYGFDNIPSTLSRLFTGENFGKQLLQIAAPS